jgi:phenylacetate-CoA ligase
MFDEPIETLSRDELAALQFERLKGTIKHAAANVPAVAERLRRAGARPDDIRSLDDLARLPLWEKSDLNDHYPLGLCAVPRSELVRIHGSSGTTTGRPTIVAYTREDLANWADLMARSLVCAGVQAGDVVHNAYGYGLFTGGMGVHYGAERLGCVVVPASGGSTARQAILIRDLGATVLTSTPSYALRIAEQAEADGIDLRNSSLRIGVFGAEPWSEGLRSELEARLAITAVDIYGLSEVMGPGVAVECAIAREGLHGWEDHFIFEIVDPLSGKPLEPGEVGELVITTLTKQALPMIRYRTRDITRISTERCSCGRTHLRIARLIGRTDDMLIVRGVNVYPSQIEEILMASSAVAPHYQLVLSRVGALDSLTIEAEATSLVAAHEYETVAASISEEIKLRVGVTCAVELKRPGELPRSEGKAVRVRDTRSRQSK